MCRIETLPALLWFLCTNSFTVLIGKQGVWCSMWQCESSDHFVWRDLAVTRQISPAQIPPDQISPKIALGLFVLGSSKFDFQFCIATSGITRVVCRRVKTLDVHLRGLARSFSSWTWIRDLKDCGNKYSMSLLQWCT